MQEYPTKKWRAYREIWTACVNGDVEIPVAVREFFGNKPPNEALFTTTMTPTADRILVERADALERTAGGLYVPETAQEATRPIRGRVLSVGPEVKQVAVGDEVIYSRQMGYLVNIAGEDYLVLREEEVFGIIHEVFPLVEEDGEQLQGAAGVVAA